MTAVATWIRQVRCLDPLTGVDQLACVGIQAGRIAAIAPPDTPLPGDWPGDTAVVDGTGCVLMPGLVDLYSHSGEPGHEDRETLDSLMAGAIAGGFTRVGILPDTVPPLDHPSALRSLLEQADTASLNPRPQLLPWAALTQGDEGEQMTELRELAQCRDLGLAGFTHSAALNNWPLLRRLLEYGRPFGVPIALWPWHQELAGQGVAREGPLAQAAGLTPQPAMAETVPVAALLELVAETGTPIHLMRLSTARSVALVAQAKERGLPVTASVSWLHLLLSTQDLLSYDPHLRLNPPLGNPEDQAALVEGVRTGVIDAIAVDHTPHTYEDKTVAFDQAPPGAIGLELALPILWQRFVASGDWPALTLVQAISTRPAQCLGLSPATLVPQAPGEAVLFNPEVRWTATPDALRSRSHNTPFLHQAVQGQVRQVWTP
jgi:dihydroorotase